MKTVHRTLCVVGLVLTVTCAQAQQPNGQRMRVPPRDESERAPGFREFIERFRRALEQRDAATLLSMVDTEIISDPFGDQLVGRDAFRKHNNLDDRDSEFWTRVSEILRLGAGVEGCETPQAYCRVKVPYWTERLTDLDSYDYSIARNENVPLYTAPKADAAIVERLSYDVVKHVEKYSQGPLEGWEEVQLMDGRRGFIREGDLYRRTGLRMWFAREDDGSWILRNLVSGD